MGCSGSNRLTRHAVFICQHGTYMHMALRFHISALPLDSSLGGWHVPQQCQHTSWLQLQCKLNQIHHGIGRVV